MINDKSVLALIPARGGSKRLPGKNIKNFKGKPLIAWTVEEAHKSGFIDKTVCSTENPEIAMIAKYLGCEVLPRPKDLASDNTSSAEVLLHALSHYDYDFVVLLQPTSPLRTVQDIDCGITLGMSTSVGPEGKTNGAVYCVESKIFKSFPYFGGKVFYMPKERSIDIDTQMDFDMAEALFKRN